MIHLVRKTGTMERYLPVASVQNDRLVRRDGVPVAVLEVRPAALEGAAGPERDALLGGFRGFLNSLDHPVQFLARLTPADYTVYAQRFRSGIPTGVPAGLDVLAGSLDVMLAGLSDRDGVLDRRFYLVIPGRTQRRWDNGGTDPLSDRVERAASALGRMGMPSVWLDGAALRAFWRACLAGTSTLPLDKTGPAFSLEVGARSLALNGEPAVGLALDRWPRYLYPGWLTGLLTLGVPLDLSLHVAPEDPAFSARRLEWKRVQLESTRSLALKRGRDPSPEEELALEDLSQLRDAVQRGRERLFQASLSLLVRAPSPAELERNTRRVQVYPAGSLGRLSAPPLRQREAHHSALPLALCPLGNWKRVDTSTLVCLFPFSPPDLDTRQGIPLGIDLGAGCPVILDPFLEASFFNANTVVVAQSGAGKSYAVKLLALRSLLQGVTHYVIDPEGEYALLAEAAGGVVVRPGASGQGLNPFALPHGDETDLAYKVGGLRRLLEVMTGERFTPERRAELDSALTDYYGQGAPGASFQGFYDFLEVRSDALALTLRPFADGSLRFLLGEGGDTQGLEPRLTVYDLSRLDPDLRPAVAHLCAETVWSRAAQESRQRALVVDEAWALLQHPEGAAFFSGMAKRARKHRLGVTAITQDAQDFLEGETDHSIAGHSGKTLVQNSAFKLLLRQDPAAMGVVAQSFNLTPSEQSWLLTCGRGEGLLITPQGRAMLRIESTPEEHRLLVAAAPGGPGGG